LFRLTLFAHAFLYIYIFFLSTFVRTNSDATLFLQAGVTPLLQEQLQQLARQKPSDRQSAVFGKKGKLVVIGQDCVDALHALRSAGEEVCICLTLFFFHILEIVIL
jgi:hypothetical protein